MLGIIDIYISADFEYKYDNHSLAYLTKSSKSSTVEMLLDTNVQKIIVKSTDLGKDLINGFLVEKVYYEDSSESTLKLDCVSLSNMMSWRIVEGQQVYNGVVEDVIKSFVNYNAITPKNPNRIIPNLVLGKNIGILDVIEEAFTEIPLDVALWEMCNKYDISYNILMDINNKQYVFVTYMGVDRSTAQNDNQWVIFAKEFDNVDLQSYTDDVSNYKSTAMVVGNYEDIDEPVVYVNDEISGNDRREVFVDARDIESIYTNEDDVDISMTEAQYRDVLYEKGANTLAEYPRIKTFESEINPHSQFIFSIHYGLGDVVTNRNDEIGILTHSRVVKVNETYDRDGYTLTNEFGTSIPNLVDKIKREVKNK